MPYESLVRLTFQEIASMTTELAPSKHSLGTLCRRKGKVRLLHQYHMFIKSHLTEIINSYKVLSSDSGQELKIPLSALDQLYMCMLATLCHSWEKPAWSSAGFFHCFNLHHTQPLLREPLLLVHPWPNFIYDGMIEDFCYRKFTQLSSAGSLVCYVMVVAFPLDRIILTFKGFSN